MNPTTDPQITAVIPTYRRPRLLRRALESVLAQTYPHLKVAVSDNASGDETAEVVAELARKDLRVQYHCHPENIGAAANFQYGMDAVETPYFSFLSDDDLLLPGFYEHAMSCLQRHAEARFFCGQAVIFAPDKGTHYLRPTRGWDERVYQAGEGTMAMTRKFFTWTSCLFSSEMRRKIGPLDRSGISDVPFMIKAAAMFPFVVSLVPCAVFSAWADGASYSMPLSVLSNSYQAMKQSIAGVQGISGDDVTRIGAILDRNMQIVVSGRLKSAFRRGDWAILDAAADFLRRHGGMSPGKKVRVMLAKERERNSLLLRAARFLLKLKQDIRMTKKSRWKRATAEELTRIYGERGTGTPGKEG